MTKSFVEEVREFDEFIQGFINSNDFNIQYLKMNRKLNLPDDDKSIFDICASYNRTAEALIAIDDKLKHLESFKQPCPSQINIVKQMRKILEGDQI